MNKKIFLVTGANKGIGYGIVNGLLKQNMKDNIIILSSRNEQLGIEAVNRLKDIHQDLSENIDYLKLDIDNITDIRLAENYINNKYGYLSVLINNAGYLNRSPGFSNSERANDIIKTFSTNFFSQVFLTESLIHLIKKDKQANNPQVLFTSSLLGQRTFNNLKLNERLSDGNINNLELLYKDYLNAANNGKISHI